MTTIIEQAKVHYRSTLVRRQDPHNRETNRDHCSYLLYAMHESAATQHAPPRILNAISHYFMISSSIFLTFSGFSVGF